MTCRRLALAPVVALVFCALVGGPVASAAPSSTAPAEPTATSAANTDSSKKRKKKRTTVSSLNKRLTRTEKDLAAARRQLRLVQRATAGLVSGLDTVVGANGSVEALLGAGLTEAVGPELAKFEALLGGALAAQAQQDANAVVVALQNPALKPEIEKLLTGIFGVSPTTIGQSIANLGPAVQTAIGQLIQQEQGVVIARLTTGQQGKPIIGSDMSDDANPLTVTGSVPVAVSGAATLQLRAGVRSAETDNGHDEVILDSVEVWPAAGATVNGGAVPVVLTGTSAFTIPSDGRLARTSDPGSLPALDIGSSQLGNPAGGAGSAITVGGTGYVMVRVSARFKDNIPSD